MAYDVYDRGPREHAMGTVSGSNYTVAAGDTFYSIGLRFGLPHTVITSANGLAPDAWVTGGTVILIPGLETKPPDPPPSGNPSLGVNTPTYGSTVYLSQPLTISGTGANLLSNKIVVKVKDYRGTAVTQIETTLSASGTWSVTFAAGLPISPNTSGTVVTEVPANNLKVDVMVYYR